MSDYAASPRSPDPLLPEEESLPEMDYPAHVRTFNSVLSVIKWFVIHVFILLIALYFFAIANEPEVGTFLILCSVALLIYGLLRRPSIRADIEKAIESGPSAPTSRHIDHTPGEGDRTA
jgi:hypothetical protein